MSLSDPDAPQGLSAVLLDGIARYFAGPRDADHLDYRAPVVDGLGSVRCDIPPDRDTSYYLDLLVPGATSLLLLSVAGWGHGRITLGPRPLRGRVSRIELDLFVVSSRTTPTLARQDTYALVDRLVAHLDRDPTCGSGGPDAGGFDLTEASAPIPAGGPGSVISGDFTRPVPLRASIQQWVRMTTTANQLVQQEA